MITQDLTTLFCTNRLLVYVDGDNNHVAVGYTGEAQFLRLMLGCPSKFNGHYFCTPKAREFMKFSESNDATEILQYAIGMLFQCDNVTVTTLSTLSKSQLGSDTLVYFSPRLSAFFPGRFPRGSVCLSSVGFFSHYSKTGTLGYIFAVNEDDFSDYYDNSDVETDDITDSDEDDSDYSADSSSAVDVSPICVFVPVKNCNAGKSLSDVKGLATCVFRGRNPYSGSTSRYCSFDGDTPQFYASPSRFYTTARPTTNSAHDKCTAMTFPSTVSYSSSKLKRLLQRGDQFLQTPIMGTEDASYVWQRMGMRTLCGENLPLLISYGYCQMLGTNLFDDEVYDLSYSSTDNILGQVRSCLDPLMPFTHFDAVTLSTDLLSELEEVSSVSTLKAWNDADDESDLQASFSVSALKVSQTPLIGTRSNCYWIKSGYTTESNPFPYSTGTGAAGVISHGNSIEHYYASDSMRYSCQSTTIDSVSRYTGAYNKYTSTDSSFSPYPIWSSGYGICSTMCLAKQTSNGYPLTISGASAGTNTGTYYPTCSVLTLGRRKGKKVRFTSDWYKWVVSYTY